MLNFITEVWMSNLFGAIYLLVGILVGVNLMKYVDPVGWVVLLHTNKDNKWAYYMNENGDKKSIKVTTFERFLYFLGLIFMIIFWPAAIAIVIACKLFQHGLTDIIPYCLSKVPTFSIKLEKEKKK